MVEKFYTPKQVAEILQIHPYTVLKWIREGKLKALKFGRVYRATESELATFLGTQRPIGRISTEVSERDASHGSGALKKESPKTQELPIENLTKQSEQKISNPSNPTPQPQEFYNINLPV